MFIRFATSLLIILSFFSVSYGQKPLRVRNDVQNVFKEAEEVFRKGLLIYTTSGYSKAEQPLNEAAGIFLDSNLDLSPQTKAGQCYAAITETTAILAQSPTLPTTFKNLNTACGWSVEIESPRPIQQPEKSKNSLLETAKRLYNEQRDYEAKETLLNLLNSDPKNADAYYLMGMIYYRFSDLKNALIYFETALICEPQMSKAKIQMARIYYETSNCFDMSKSVEDILKTDKKNADALELQAKIPVCHKLAEENASYVIDYSAQESKTETKQPNVLSVKTTKRFGVDVVSAGEIMQSQGYGEKCYLSYKDLPSVFNFRVGMTFEEVQTLLPDVVRHGTFSLTKRDAKAQTNVSYDSFNVVTVGMEGSVLKNFMFNFLLNKNESAANYADIDKLFRMFLLTEKERLSETFVRVCQDFSISISFQGYTYERLQGFSLIINKFPDEYIKTDKSITYVRVPTGRKTNLPVQSPQPVEDVQPAKESRNAQPVSEVQSIQTNSANSEAAMDTQNKKKPQTTNNIQVEESKPLPVPSPVPEVLEKTPIFKGNYEGSSFYGYKNKRSGRFVFDDDNRQLIFVDNNKNEVFKVAYNSISKAYLSNELRKPSASGVYPITLADAVVVGLMQKALTRRIWYLNIVINKDREIACFYIKDENNLRKLLKTIGEKSGLKQNGEAYYR